MTWVVQISEVIEIYNKMAVPFILCSEYIGIYYTEDENRVALFFLDG